MNPIEAIIIGAIAGLLVYFAVIIIDSVIKIDDPVGAISVHLVCGIWGTLAVGLFGTSAGMEQIQAQLIGIINQSASNWILPDVIPLFFVRPFAAHAKIPMIRLPAMGRIGVQFREFRFAILHPIIKRDIRIGRPSK
jgi:hypothetical protein